MRWNARESAQPSGRRTGVAWLSSARAVKCEIKFFNERNPCRQLPACRDGDSGGTAGDKPEEGGDDVKSSWPLCPGPHTCYNGRYRARRSREAERTAKAGPSTDCALQPGRMKLESLVIAHQHGAVNTFPGLVHTARHTIRAGGARSRQPNREGGGSEGTSGEGGEVVTR